MNKKRLFFRITIACAILLLIASVIITISLISTYGFKKKPMNISLVIKTIDPSFEFWQIIKSGVESACNEEGALLTVSGPMQENDLNSQIEILTNLIEQKPSAIILAAIDYNGLVPAVEKINENHIPIIIIDSGINSGIPLSFIATDNIVAGEKAGQKMSELLSYGDHIAIISYIKGTSTAIEREKGVKKAISENKKLVVDNVYYCDNLREKAGTITTAILKENPGIKGIIALNDPSTTGVARIIKQKNLKDRIQLVGFDNSIEEIDYLEQGVIKALIVQKPFNMGYLSVKAAIKSVRGEIVEKRIDTGANLITADNMYSEENQKLLFPIIKEVPNN
jgi:ribose transport system substrate-binding protein